MAGAVEALLASLFVVALAFGIITACVLYVPLSGWLTVPIGIAAASFVSAAIIS